MRLSHNIHLGYCTNIHRGETWAETFDGLQSYTNEVRKRVAPDSPYGIGLRLSADAAAELSADVGKRRGFREWLEKNNCYVFTINGFPYGKFHNTRVKEQVYVPDWTTKERLEYTNLLFDLICELAPEGESVSVSTLPGSFKEFIQLGTETAQLDAICKNLIACSAHIDQLREATGRDIHLGLEPEPLGLFETSAESVAFFDRLTTGLEKSARARLLQNIGINYDTCHLAIEYEEPAVAIGRLREAGIRISKIHLSSALRLQPTQTSIKRLSAFVDEVYLHQVVVRTGDKITHRFRDLPDALEWFAEGSREEKGDEWRVHFHVPIHSRPEELFEDTRDHVSGVIKLLGKSPGWCQHIEMETYTWEVLPEELRAANVVEQLVAEYEWCLGGFIEEGMRHEA